MNDWKTPQAGAEGDPGANASLPVGDPQMPLSMLAGGDPGGMGGLDGGSVDSGPKRSLNGFLLMVIVVAIGGGTLWAMRMTNLIGPADASANEAEKKVTAALERFAAANKADASKSVEDLMQDADQILAVLANDPVKNQIELDRLSKNPFELVVTKAKVDKGPDTGETIDRARQARRQALELELKGMKLQTLLSGAKPMAVISGKVVRVGDTVGSFAVDAIEATGVKLTADSEVFMLAMSLPDTTATNPRK